MQILYSSIVPVVEFASISLLLNDSPDVGESIMVASPLSTTPYAYESLLELQEYLLALKSTSASTPASTSASTSTPASASANATKAPTCAQQLAADDLEQTSVPQLFKSRHAGLALYYWMVKDPDFIQSSFSVLMSSRHVSRTEKVAGVVLCVGVTGGGTTVLSPLVSTLVPRLLDVVALMRRMSSGDAEECKTSYKALLTTLLLTDDEERRTNGMVEAEQVTMELVDVEATLDQASSRGGLRGMTKKSRSVGMRRGASSDGFSLNATFASTSSADLARLLEKRSAVLSVVEKDCRLRKYEHAAKVTKEEKKNARRRKVKPADEVFRDFDFTSPQQAKTHVAELAAQVAMLQNHANGTSHKNGASNAGSATAPAAALQKSAKDNTSSRKGKLALAPPRSNPISASRRPSSQEKSKRAQLSSQQQQPAFNAFDMGNEHDERLNGSFHGIAFPGLDSASAAAASGTTRNRKTLPDVLEEGNRNASRLGNASRGSRRGSESLSTGFGSATFSGLSVDGSSIGMSSSGLASNATYNSKQQTSNDDDNGDFSPTPTPPPPPPTPPNMRVGHHSEDSPARILVNVALNEDLTCSYRQSKISSCTIEGVVQVQVKSDVRAEVATPFMLLLRDPSHHVRMIQENRRYADDKSESLHPNDGVDYKFIISVPRAPNYFPVMRYKCSAELRPVPIRVQTRVRIAGLYCRVALQISSNPANEDDLTDLTIIMGVPEEVRGETLSTSPPGGIWNASKRSVIWCVAELGEGEKFQLQAQFEIDPAAAQQAEREKPKFPVLVRCQCMYAQLSDVELEVVDIPEVLPADVAMKLARRFRLSHRERS